MSHFVLVSRSWLRANGRTKQTTSLSKKTSELVRDIQEPWSLQFKLAKKIIILTGYTKNASINNTEQCLIQTVFKKNVAAPQSSIMWSSICALKHLVSESWHLWAMWTYRRIHYRFPCKLCKTFFSSHDEILFLNLNIYNDLFKSNLLNAVSQQQQKKNSHKSSFQAEDLAWFFKLL